MATVETKVFKKLLRKNGYSVTAPRLRLFAVLQKRSSLTIAQLIKLLRLHNQVTVYRNIKVFEELGVIKRLQLGWHSKLELSDAFRHHHHHLSCTSCGKVWALKEDPSLEWGISRLSRQQDFKAIDHQLEITGLCASCQKLTGTLE